MRYISRLILILCMFLVSISANAFLSDFSSLEIKTVDTISSISVLHQDYIGVKIGESYSLTTQKNDGLFVNGRKSDCSFDNSFSNCLLGNTEQYRSLLSYLYNQSFLHNKSKVHFSVSLSEIQPNAP